MNTTELKIERIENPTLEFFQQHISTSRKPIIMTGIVNNWSAYSLWTDDYLKTILGDIDVSVCASKDSVLTMNNEEGFNKLIQQMKFSDFIDVLKLHQNSTDIYYYLTRASIPKLFPELMKDIEIPLYCQDKVFYNDLINLWLGTKDSNSPLHYDLDDNFLAQVKGRKRIILLAPNQTKFLYPFPVNSDKVPTFSPIPNVTNPDITKFPKCQKAKYFEIILEAGEMLFLPAFWWHQIFTIDSPQFPTISVNFWYKPPLMSSLATSLGRPTSKQTMNLLRYKVWRWRRKISKKIKTKIKLNLNK